MHKNGAPRRQKHIIGRRLQEGLLSDAAPKPDSVRKSVEYRWLSWESPRDENEGSPMGEAQNGWTESQTNALLGASGGRNDRINRARTRHTVKSVRAKIARLDYRYTKFMGLRSLRLTPLQPSLVLRRDRFGVGRTKASSNAGPQNNGGSGWDSFCGHIMIEFHLTASDARPGLSRRSWISLPGSHNLQKECPQYLGRYW